MNCSIYQIYYSEETKQSNDPGFLQLDNLANERPDWREYWPIRNFLLNNELENDRYYGFFSPKFKQKTNLDSSEVYKFIQANQADVIHFSPFFDQSAFPINIFSQATAQHQGIADPLEKALKILNKDFNPFEVIMNSTNTIFCNFFVAKKVFWKIWLKNCEMIFKIAESNTSELAMALNANTNHDSHGAAVKVFVIERIASSLAAAGKIKTIKSFDPMSLPLAGSKISIYRDDLLILDALKLAYDYTQNSHFINAFYLHRSFLLSKLEKDITN